MSKAAGEGELPKYDELMVPVLRALRTLGGSGSVEEIFDVVQEDLRMPSDAVEAVYEKSRASIFPDRLAWARSYLKLAGYVENPQRGLWVLTQKGQDVDLGDEEAIKKDVRKCASATYRKSAKKAKAPASDDLPEEEGLDEENWTDRLLVILLKMPPDAFERLCQRILREAGFTRVEVTGRSGDGGIDGHGVLRVKLVSFQVLFQCKRYKDTVSSPVIRDFRGAMQGRADKGLIMTTGRFTADARKEATRDGAPAIDLIDGDDLCDLLKELKIGVKTEFVERVDIDEAVFASI
ncbi:restriction system protein [Parvibaculum indicum]|uniref:restriction endonuclease n=1 Tax=Parvibaculum indicum TaxID=562969 RepID=UPI001420D34C|nr:restriction endonuclease [Parvibaculum indicum]NIJ40931.1 restriction system protein [Parvibaculum indicum]